ncbi:hypothetical protein ACA29_06155, partial [Lederbergia galactosidilytica]
FVREEAKFIPAKMVKVQHIALLYECKACKRDASMPAQLKRGVGMPHSLPSSAVSPANAICLSLAETAKSNGIDFYAMSMSKNC